MSSSPSSPSCLLPPTSTTTRVHCCFSHTKNSSQTCGAGYYYFFFFSKSPPWWRRRRKMESARDKWHGNRLKWAKYGTANVVLCRWQASKLVRRRRWWKETSDKTSQPHRSWSFAQCRVTYSLNCNLYNLEHSKTAHNSSSTISAIFHPSKIQLEQFSFSWSSLRKHSLRAETKARMIIAVATMIIMISRDVGIGTSVEQIFNFPAPPTN